MTDRPVSVSFAALRAHEQRIAGMYADPELVGDLLLVGLVLARCVDFGDPPLDTVLRGAAAAVYGGANHAPILAASSGHAYGSRIETRGLRRVIGVLRSDVRRYEPDMTSLTTCQRLVNRRPPGEADSPARPSQCGRLCFRSALLTDPLTGNRYLMGACRRPACLRWWEALCAKNGRELAEHPPPAPPANRGGLLARHLDEIDWPQLYRSLDPEWKPPHEAPGWRPPKLSLLAGSGGVGEEGVTPVGKPSLTVLEGGWR